MQRFYLGKSEFDKAAEKGVVIRCGQGTMTNCSAIEKGEAFKESVVPALEMYYSDL